MIAMKNRMNELKEQLKELKEINSKLEDKIKFKDDMLECRPSIATFEKLQKENEHMSKMLDSQKDS